MQCVCVCVCARPRARWCARVQSIHLRCSAATDLRELPSSGGESPRACLSCASKTSNSAGQSAPTLLVLFVLFPIKKKKSDNISPFGPIIRRRLPLPLCSVLTSVVMRTSYFQTRKLTAREEQDVPRAPGVSCSGVFKKNEHGVTRNAGTDAAWEKPPPTDVEQRRGPDRRGEERGEKRSPCGVRCNKRI